MDIQILPSDIEAEKALIGCMTVDNNAILDALEVLKPESFYYPEHKIIYQSIIDLNAEGNPVDVITIKNELEKQKLLEKVGGLQYLVLLQESIPAIANYKEYIQIIYEKWILRTIISTGQDMVKLGFDSSNTKEEIIDLAEKQIYALSSSNSKQSYSVLKDILVSTFVELDQLYKNKSQITGLPTGFVDFDKKTAGLHGSNLIIIAARPGMGKSALAINIATHVAVKENKGVLIFNMEMSKNDLAKRILSAESHIDNHKISTGNIDTQEWEKLAAASSILSGAKLYIDDTPGINIMEIRSKARRLKESGDLGLIVIDYLQLIEPVSRKNTSREQEISEISRGLKKLAMELDVPIIALSQLSRAAEKKGKGEDKRPMLSDLRESGAIEQDADMVVFIYRDDYYNPDSEKANIAEIILAKHRGGSIGTIELLWMGNYTKFDNLGDREDEGY